jgi:aspartate carbamoyltransferase regulatory subunit
MVLNLTVYNLLKMQKARTENILVAVKSNQINFKDLVEIGIFKGRGVVVNSRRLLLIDYNQISI